MQHEGSHNFNGKHHISTIEMIDDWLTDREFDDYLKFRVVRNPIDWLVTCWIINDAKQTSFYKWATTKGLGFMTYGTLFWRYHHQTDYNLRFEDDLTLQINSLMLIRRAPTITLEHRGKTKDKPRWQDILSSQQIERLTEFYPDTTELNYVRPS